MRIGLPIGPTSPSGRAAASSGPVIAGAIDPSAADPPRLRHLLSQLGLHRPELGGRGRGHSTAGPAAAAVPAGTRTAVSAPPTALRPLDLPLEGPDLGRLRPLDAPRRRPWAARPATEGLQSLCFRRLPGALPGWMGLVFPAPVRIEARAALVVRHGGIGLVHDNVGGIQVEEIVEAVHVIPEIAERISEAGDEGIVEVVQHVEGIFGRAHGYYFCFHARLLHKIVLQSLGRRRQIRASGCR